MVQTLLQETEFKETGKEEKKLVLGEKQLLTLYSGEIVTVEELVNSTDLPSLVSWDHGFIENQITCVKEVTTSLHHLRSKKGCDLYCSRDTYAQPYRSADEPVTIESLINMEYKKGVFPPHWTRVSFFIYLPFFGTKKVSHKYLDIIASSFEDSVALHDAQLQSVYVPRMLSLLDRDSLVYFIQTYVLPRKRMYSFTKKSKNIMIALLSKLYIPFYGVDPAGKIRWEYTWLDFQIRSDRRFDIRKYDTLRSSGNVEQKAYEISLNKKHDTIINGILLCPT